jgi:hypothetical protein
LKVTSPDGYQGDHPAGRLPDKHEMWHPARTDEVALVAHLGALALLGSQTVDVDGGALGQPQPDLRGAPMQVDPFFW